MLELLLLGLKFFVVASAAVALFWLIQIRFGSIEDLDQSSWFVKVLRPAKRPAENDADEAVAIATIEGSMEAAVTVMPPEMMQPLPAVVYERTRLLSIVVTKKTSKPLKRSYKAMPEEATVRDYPYSEPQTTKLIEEIQPVVSKYVH